MTNAIAEVILEMNEAVITAKKARNNVIKHYAGTIDGLEALKEMVKNERGPLKLRYYIYHKYINGEDDSNDL